MPVGISITTNDKYRFVIEGRAPKDELPPCGCDPLGRCEECPSGYWEDHEYIHALCVYRDYVKSGEKEREERENLPNPATWQDVQVSSDPDLLSKMATYFDGVRADEPADLIAAKLRLMPLDTYWTAQSAAGAELRSGPDRHSLPASA